MEEKEQTKAKTKLPNTVMTGATAVIVSIATFAFTSFKKDLQIESLRNEVNVAYERALRAENNLRQVSNEWDKASEQADKYEGWFSDTADERNILAALIDGIENGNTIIIRHSDEEKSTTTYIDKYVYDEIVRFGNKWLDQGEAKAYTIVTEKAKPELGKRESKYTVFEAIDSEMVELVIKHRQKEQSEPSSKVSSANVEPLKEKAQPAAAI